MLIEIFRDKNVADILEYVIVEYNIDVIIKI